MGKNYLKEYYANGNEDIRFTKDKAHQVEFIVTNKYIEKYLKPNDKILEIGAATGAYSLYYANKGYNVESIELVKENIDIFKTKIKPNMKVKVRQGNALNLTMYKDNTFDITLVLGPLYHLYTEKDKDKALNEAIRVTKKGGKIFIAYLPDDSVILNYCVVKGNISRLPELADKNYHLKDIPEEIFTTFNIKKFELMMNNYKVKYLEDISVDGLSTILKDYINKFNDEEFNIWLNYQLATCNRKELEGYSSHKLYICEKE